MGEGKGDDFLARANLGAKSKLESEIWGKMFAKAAQAGKVWGGEGYGGVVWIIVNFRS